MALSSTLGAEVYAIVAGDRGVRAAGMPADASDRSTSELLSALSTVTAAPPDHPDRPGMLRGIAGSLHAAGRGDALAIQIHQRSTLSNQFRYEREPTWSYGTHGSRRALALELWARGSEAADRTEAEMDTRPSLCRAAVLLAAQEGFPIGAATLARLLRDERFGELTGWAGDAVAALTGLLAAERVRTGEYVAAVRRASDALEPLLLPAANLDDAHLNAFCDSAERLAALAANRPDVQWRLANLVWRMANVARRHTRADVLTRLDAARQRWEQSLAEPAAARWLEEALTAGAPALRTSGVRRVSGAALAQQFRNVSSQRS